MDEQTAVSVLKEIKEALDKCEIEFWLESGVLLGAVREGGFIPWDRDLDLGTWDTSMPKMKMLASELCEKGFETYYSPYHNSMAIMKTGISADLVFWRLDGERAIMPLRYRDNLFGEVLFNSMWITLYSHHGKVNAETLNSIHRKLKFGLIKLTDLLPGSIRVQFARLLDAIARKTGNRRGLVVTPSRFFQTLSTVDFYGMTFNMPADTEGYLVYYFGENWRVPRRDWQYSARSGGDKKKVLSNTEHPGKEKWEYRKSPVK